MLFSDGTSAHVLLLQNATLISSVGLLPSPFGAISSQSNKTALNFPQFLFKGQKPPKVEEHFYFRLTTNLFFPF